MKRLLGKKKFVMILAVVIVIVIAAISCAGSGSEAVTVTTVQAVRGELQESISTSGTVTAEEVKVFFAPSAGKLAEVKAAVGDAVKKGDVLISYDSTQLDYDFRQAVLQQEKSNAGYSSAVADSADNQTKLTEANTNISVLEQQIADNKAYLKDLQSKLSQSQRDTSNALAAESYDLNQEAETLTEEIGKLDPSDADTLTQKEKKLKSVQAQISRNAYLQQIANSSDYVAQMEEEIANVQELIADYEEYKAKMESQKSSSEAGVLDSYDKISYEADKELADIAYAEAQSAYYESKSGLCAGFDGVVTEVSAVEGATVSEGMQLLTLESTERVKVSFSVSGQDVEKLALGQQADITIAGRSYSGTVSKINHMASVNASNTPMIGAEIHIEEPDDKIILGLDAKVKVQTRAVEDALLVPVEALNADRDGDFLYVVENGAAVRKPVVCGISNDTYTVITEGITEEDQIVLSYYGSLEEGMAVTAVPEM
jgi:RND family efflux transporter MFP subunit